MHSVLQKPRVRKSHPFACTSGYERDVILSLLRPDTGCSHHLSSTACQLPLCPFLIGIAFACLSTNTNVVQGDKVKTCVILNPSAGSAETFQAVEDFSAEADTVVRQTQKSGDAQQFATQAIEQGAELVLAGGGDGTIGEVVNGMFHHSRRVPLGILPLGTGNDFARALEMPLGISEAIQVIRQGVTRPVDLIRIHNNHQTLRYFVNVAVSGFTEDAKDRVEARFKNNWGLLGYVMAAMEALPEVTPYHVRLTLDNDEPREYDASIVVVANSRFMSGGMNIVPIATCDDGLCDVLIFTATSAMSLGLLAPFVLAGDHLDSDLVQHFRARSLTIEAEPRLPFHVDDEYLLHTKLDFEVLPGALEVIVPAS